MTGRNAVKGIRTYRFENNQQPAQFYFTSPKTKKSNRTIKMPTFFCEEMQEYIKMLYDIKPDERLFTVTKSYLNHEMERGAKQMGVKKIRVHNIRHSAQLERMKELMRSRMN